jgi:hypothetical protein
MPRRLRPETVFILCAAAAVQAAHADDSSCGPVGPAGRALRRLQDTTAACGLADVPVRLEITEPYARTIGRTLAWTLSDLYSTRWSAGAALGNARRNLRALCRALLEHPRFRAAATPAALRVMADDRPPSPALAAAA